MNRDENTTGSVSPRFRPDALLSGELAGRGNRDARLIRINADAIADAHLGVIERGSILLAASAGGFEIVAAGPSVRIDRLDIPESTPQLTLRDRLIMPAMVNAHTHLDLTHIGPCPHEPGDGFVSWVERIRTGRAIEDQHIKECVGLGIEKSIAGGSGAVGDIAGAPAGRLTDTPAKALARSPLIGVSYLEFFGIGSSASGAIRKIATYLDTRYPVTLAETAGSGIAIGLQPHAPNTVDLGVYRWAALAAAARGIPLSTHLAETPEEREFIVHGTGPQRAMLERFGIWEDAVLDHIGRNRHPVEHLFPILKVHPFLAAHVNDADDRAIALLAESGTSIAYCPRASAYFGAPEHFGPHRYRDMLDAGINVCLGTDSIVNLNTPDRISILDEMRLLWDRDRPEPRMLLAMATTNGARALGLDEAAFTLAQGANTAGLIALPLAESGGDCWDRAMAATGGPQWLFLGEK